MTTYEHIAQNKRRTALLVLLFPVTFALLTYGVLWFVFSLSGGDAPQAAVACDAYGDCVLAGGMSALNQTLLWLTPVLWGVAMVWILISYFTGDQLILRAANAIEIEKQDQPEIYRLVENVAITRGLPLPRVYIINDDSLNAFATGRDPQHASVALTKGIVKKLDRAELEGVIAHEMAHVENRDIRLMLITVAGISFFTLAGEICFRLALSSRRSGGKNSGQAQLLFLAIGIIMLVYGYVIAPLLRLAVSRQREYQADATAALTTRNPAALADALAKISGNSHTETLAEHPSMAAMCIESPTTKAGLFASLSNLAATHPPIEERIRRLREMDGRI